MWSTNRANSLVTTRLGVRGYTALPHACNEDHALDRAASDRLLRLTDCIHTDTIHLCTRSGNPGDTKSVGGGIHEMRIHVGSGYRIYFASTGKIVLLLLCGGDKSTQARDIARAKRLLAELGKE